mmetsp:Transcript_39411/g.61437  ORF Transcript_39411/g.61437 Transcript_39411/m.61437 type:complete len:99 (-) Transcript_39411:420-716(-)
MTAVSISSSLIKYVLKCNPTNISEFSDCRFFFVNRHTFTPISLDGLKKYEITMRKNADEVKTSAIFRLLSMFFNMCCAMYVPATVQICTTLWGKEDLN